MRLAIIDNHDSFTFNLSQYLGEILGSEPAVIPNDADAALTINAYDAFVISPGPGHPANPRDFGISATIIKESAKPVLGVCLGHQGIVTGFDGRVVHAPEPYHGRRSKIRHDGNPLFDSIPDEFEVVRYHSLIAIDPLPRDLRATARTSDGLIMAIAHESRPIWGVQFHPESIYSEHGKQLLRNYCRLADRSARRRPASGAVSSTSRNTAARSKKGNKKVWRVEHRCLEATDSSEVLFDCLFSDSPASFWLDSSEAPSQRSRFSFFGAADGPYSFRLEYGVDSGLRRVDLTGAASESQGDIFTAIDESLSAGVDGGDELPFDFCGGFVGYIGYECKSVTTPMTNRHVSLQPDATMLFIDRFIAIDHATNLLYIVGLNKIDESSESLLAWFDDVQKKLRAPARHLRDGRRVPIPGQVVNFSFEAERDEYLRKIEKTREFLRDGDTYELCLTNRIRCEANVVPLDLYRVLRKKNPAPYSAFLKSDSTSVLCTSPERYLRLSRNGIVETKPIKGTRARSSNPALDAALAWDLATNQKDLAENLMVTDLLRNDLGRACEIGSIWVPRLMHVESYASVHQLISTIRGQLRKDRSVVDLIRNAFPGGSMTGCPKPRTMELIDGLENSPRGIYSGALGYLSLNGAADLNIVIRTIICSGAQLEIGVGGAIVALSDSNSEFEETLIKGRPMMRAIAEYVTGDAEAFRIIDQGVPTPIAGFLKDEFPLEAANRFDKAAAESARR